MSIEIDIELEFESQSQQKQQNLTSIVTQLPKKYAVEQRGTSKTTYIVYKDAPISYKPLDEAIISFLHPLLAIRGNISALNASVRVGMFYNISETVVCPVRLSKRCIKMLNQFGVELDVTGYPCSDDE
jgi:hypothetical protein